jgi:lactoylglutathione lyase
MQRATTLLYQFVTVRLRGADKEALVETNKLYRGRLVDHIQLVVPDLAASRRFYAAVLEVFGIPIGGEGPGFFWADELVVSSPDSVAAAGQATGRAHIAFQAKDPAMVDRFHAIALAAGGKDNGKPGPRPYHPGYYAAFVLDPAGNNIEAVHHGAAKRSAESIEIRF